MKVIVEEDSPEPTPVREPPYVPLKMAHESMPPPTKLMQEMMGYPQLQTQTQPHY